MPRTKTKVYQVYCGDAEHWFSYTQKKYTTQEVAAILAERIQHLHVEILPGLLFRHIETGDLFKPQLSIGLVPAGHEIDNGGD